MQSQEKIFTAGIIIIGNEILSGRTQDKNTQHIASKLNEVGVVLKEGAVIPDDGDVIIATVQRFSESYDYVFTTGGIGPTHDDITAEFVGKAFGKELELNEQAKGLLLEHYGEEDLTEARLKMAHVPEGAELILNPVSSAPAFRVENVFVMAGIPRIMQAMLDNILPLLKGGKPVLSETITVQMQESMIAPILTKAQEEHPDLDIGSYPFYQDGNHGVSVVIRGYNADEIAVVKALIEQGLDL